MHGDNIVVRVYKSSSTGVTIVAEVAIFRTKWNWLSRSALYSSYIVTFFAVRRVVVVNAYAGVGSLSLSLTIHAAALAR